MRSTIVPLARLLLSLSFDWEMASARSIQWIYSADELENSPSRKDGVDSEKELSYRQQAANLIQDMGQRLSLNQLTINTAIVYMHRFYMYHSFKNFSRYAIAPTALFLAAKVEEQPKKLEHVLKICYACLHQNKTTLNLQSEAYLKQSQDLIQNEIILLQTLGFDISVDHPHKHVVKCTQLVKASRDLSQMAYFMATNSLHLTTFCLLYKPTVVAAMCIHLSCKWSNYEIPLSSDGKPYWAYMDSSVTEPMLNTIVKEFLKILNRCPTRLRKLRNYRSEMEDQKDKEVKQAPQPPIQIFHSAQPEATTSTVAAKEKKPMSLEEYKRTHPKPPPPPPKSSKPAPGPQQKSSHYANKAPTRPTESKGHSQPPHPGQSVDPNKSRSHPSNHSRASHVKQEIRTDGAQQSRPWPGAAGANPRYPDKQRSNHDGPSSSHQASQRNMMAPASKLPHSASRKDAGSIPAPSQNRPDLQLMRMENVKGEAPTDSDEVLAVSKDLEGRIRSEKSIQHQNATDRGSHHRSATQPIPASHHSVKAEHHDDSSRRHHSEKLSSQSADAHNRPGKDAKWYDYKQLLEIYKKAPDKVKLYLKQKAQSVPLTDDEKFIYGKAHAWEEERRRRKALGAGAKQKAKLQDENPASPAGLTLRIKLPPNQAAGGSNTTVAKIIGSTSGSASDGSPVRSRKRPHGDGPDHHEHHSSKHSRRSDSHHKPHHHSSGNPPSSGSQKFKRSHPSKKHSSRSSSKQPEPIADTIFQKSLHDAMVQSNIPPTATVKKPSNGSDGSYFMANQIKSEFDPKAPVSATVPDEIFEDEHDSGAFTGSSSIMGSLVSHNSAQSTPESGEIPDNHSPQRSHKGNRQQSLFSPNSDDLKLHRSSSGFGYHSSNENDFPSQNMIRKPVQ